MITDVLFGSVILMDDEVIGLFVPFNEVFGRTEVYSHLHLVAPRRLNDVNWIEQFVFNDDFLVF